MDARTRDGGSRELLLIDRINLILFRAERQELKTNKYLMAVIPCPNNTIEVAVKCNMPPM